MELQFRFQWSISDKYGLVKKSTILSFSNTEKEIEVLDGVQNVLPPNVNKNLQITKSNLVNAYKRNELIDSVKLGLITLSANIVDRAEPSEALRASTIWSIGLDSHTNLMSSNQLSGFRKGVSVNQEYDIKGERGAYFQVASMTLAPEEENSWYTVLDINKNQSDVVALIEELKKSEDILNSLITDLIDCEKALKQIVAASDGIQFSSDKNSIVRHFANTTFNVMRGGIFASNYKVDSDDFTNFVQQWNKSIHFRYKDLLSSLPGNIDYSFLLEKCIETGDQDLKRLCLEYMPLTFSRRHGDPSRPWNAYNIRLKNNDGSQIINYEGNWRDIFQNWETLGLSFPGFLRSMFTKFLNASTIDGYNPYRIDRSGVDWEVEDPDDPWAFIGYWGDHQVIYLLKLLEAFQNHYPDELSGLLTEKEFTFSNVPYQIKSYQDILEDPYSTITFNTDLHDLVLRRVEEMGFDGKFVIAKDGEILKVSLLEKLLVMLLAKLSNYVPGGGIWLNTQRPEWNDANNALVGYGVSMVTLYYIRRLLTFLKPIISDGSYLLSVEVAVLLNEVSQVFHSNQPENLNNGISRKKMVDALGLAGEKYRDAAYRGFSGRQNSVDSKGISDFIDQVIVHVDQTIRENKRTDGLYHSYNLLDIKDDSLEVNFLYEMLEGQVSLLSSGLLNTQECLGVLDAMKQSRIFRDDQYSYLLYPNRELNRFLEKNIVPSASIQSNDLLKTMLSNQDERLVAKDVAGNYHFNADFSNVMDLKIALNKLRSEKQYSTLIDNYFDSVCELFEATFNHKEFTGRSGTFFGYEGLGSIYWHMVSKLLLAVQENLIAAKKSGESSELIGRLIDHYYEIRAGIGINKSAKLYGGFPTDPYSHTPWHKGAQQPGMTGQVKEDIISRWGELGLTVQDGEIHINPFFLNPDEFISEAFEFEFYGLNGQVETMSLPENSLVFTYCQVPFVFMRSDDQELEISYENGEVKTYKALKIPKDIASNLFLRNGKVVKIEVRL